MVRKNLLAVIFKITIANIQTYVQTVFIIMMAFHEVYSICRVI